MVARFSASQRSCSSWASSKRKRTSSMLAEPVDLTCFCSLASSSGSRISIFIGPSLALLDQGTLLGRNRRPFLRKSVTSLDQEVLRHTYLVRQIKGILPAAISP